MGHLYRAYMSHHARFSRSTTYSAEGIFILTATLSSIHDWSCCLRDRIVKNGLILLFFHRDKILLIVYM